MTLYRYTCQRVGNFDPFRHTTRRFSAKYKVENSRKMHRITSTDLELSTVTGTLYIH